MNSSGQHRIENPVQCRNCGAEATGPYCAQCGEEHDSNCMLPMKRVVQEIGEELFEWDSRIFRTAKALLIHPGLLTVEYAQGHRKRFVPPIKLYLFLSAVYFLSFIVFDPLSFQITQGVNLGNESDPLLSVALARSGLTQAELEKQISDSIHKSLPMVFIVLVPLMALGLKVVYYSTGRFFHEHFIFCIHYSCFTFVQSLVCLPVALIHGPTYIYGTFIWALVYYVLAHIRNYREEPWQLVLKLGLLGFYYFVLYMVVLGVAGMLALLAAVTRESAGASLLSLLLRVFS